VQKLIKSVTRKTPMTSNFSQKLKKRKYTLLTA
jgi:hypothetical protein